MFSRVAFSKPFVGLSKEEKTHLYVLGALGLVFVCGGSFALYKTRCLKGVSHRKLPPCAKQRWPAQGTFMHLGPTPCQTLAKICSQEYGGILKIYMGEIPTVIITSPQIITQVNPYALSIIMHQLKVLIMLLFMTSYGCWSYFIYPTVLAQFMAFDLLASISCKCNSIAITSLAFKPWYQFNMMLFYIHNRLWVGILIFHNNIKWLSLVMFLLCAKGRIVYRINHAKVENALSQECGPKIILEEHMQLVKLCTPWKCGPWTHNIVGYLCHV